MTPTTTAAVQTLLGVDYNGTTDLTFSVAAANSLVVRVISSYSTEEQGSVLDADSELLARMLGAHFYCMSDPQYKNRSTLSTSGNFRGADGKGLDATTYGQNALGFDPTQGWLNALYNRMAVGGGWLGKPADEQLSYYDRNGIPNFPS